MSISIDVEDLTDQALSPILSRLLGESGAFTTDWTVSGPLIERYKIALDYMDLSADIFSSSSKASQILKDFYTKNYDPIPVGMWTARMALNEVDISEEDPVCLIAVVRAIIKYEVASGKILSVPPSLIATWIKNMPPVIDMLIEGSSNHDSKQLAEFNTYELTPKRSAADALENFQTVVEIVRGLDGRHLKILNSHTTSRTGLFLIDILIIEIP